MIPTSSPPRNANTLNSLPCQASRGHGNVIEHILRPHRLCPAAAAGIGGGQEKGAEPDGTTGPPAAAETSAVPPPLRTVHTTNFPALLRQLGASLLVTTYQAGKLVMVRDERDHLNTHFRTFKAPMGMSLAGDRLAVGTRIQVWEFVDVPAVAAGLDPPGRHDACFRPRSSHVTGNIQIHEMAWGAGGELWVVNTRFSCLCTLDGSASFTPRWRPPFVTALEPTDRCHLNGLAMVHGRPRYVTALGETDEPAGWQATGPRPPTTTSSTAREISTAGMSARFLRPRRRRHVAGELVHGARRDAGRRDGVAAGAVRTDPWRGGVGRERECAARSVHDGVGAVLLHQRLFNTRGATEPCVETD